MKTLITTAALMMCALTAGAQHAYRISGSIPGMPDSSKVVLVSEDGYQPKELTSADISNGMFVLTGEYRKPELCKMKFYVPGKKGPYNVCSIRLMLDTDPMTFTADTATIMSSNYSMFAEGKVAFSGSGIQSQYMEYLAATRSKEYTADSASYAQASAWFDNNGNEDITAEYKKRAATAAAEYEKCVDDFVQSHPDYYPAAALLAKRIYKDFAYTAEQYDAWLEMLKNNPDTAHVNFIKRNIDTAKKYAIGARFADFEGKCPDNSTAKLSELMQQGKYTLVDFWASWCGPCRAAIPKVKDMYTEFGDRLQVVSASVDEKEEAWRKAEKAENMPWPQMWIAKEKLNGIAQAYMINSIPRLVLIAPDGGVVICTHDPALIREALLK